MCMVNKFQASMMNEMGEIDSYRANKNDRWWHEDERIGYNYKEQKKAKYDGGGHEFFSITWL